MFVERVVNLYYGWYSIGRSETPWPNTLSGLSTKIEEVCFNEKKIHWITQNALVNQINAKKNSIFVISVPTVHFSHFVIVWLLLRTVVKRNDTTEDHDFRPQSFTFHVIWHFQFVLVPQMLSVSFSLVKGKKHLFSYSIMVSFHWMLHL